MRCYEKCHGLRVYITQTARNVRCCQVADLSIEYNIIHMTTDYEYR